MGVFVRAQSSIETIVMVAIGLVLLTAMTQVIFSSVGVYYGRQQQMIATQALSILANEIDDVYFSGPGTTRTIRIEIPEQMDLANSYIQGKSLVMNVNGSEYVRTTKVPVRGVWPNATGAYTFKLVAYGDFVAISSDLLEFNPNNISVSLSQGAPTTQDINILNLSSSEVDYTFSINFSHANASVTSDDTGVVSFLANDYNNITLNFSCERNAIGTYDGNLLFDGEVDVSIPIKIFCEAAQTRLSIYPSSKDFNQTELTSATQTLQVCNSSNINYPSSSSSVSGAIAPYAFTSFSGEINANSCRNLSLAISAPQTGDQNIYLGTLTVESSGFTATADLNLFVIEVEEVVGGGSAYYFASTANNDLNHLFDFNGFVKQRSSDNAWVATGELDWNNDAVADLNSWRDPNLVSYFDMESVGKNVTIGISSSSGYALNLNGSTVGGTNTTLYNNTTGTWAVWFYPTASVDNQGLFYVQGGPGIWIRLKTTGTNIQGLTVTPNHSINNGDYVLNQWNFAAFTYQNNEIKLYVNGTLYKSTFTGSYTANSARIDVGTVSGIKFTGRIDSVFGWSRVLTDSELEDLYYHGSGLAVSTTGTFPSTGASMNSNKRAYYPYDESSGSTSADTSGNGKTLSGITASRTTGRPLLVPTNVASIADRTGNGTEAGLANGATISGNGLWDSNALVCDGTNDFATIGYGYGVNPSTTPHTLIAWVKPDAPDENVMIFSTGANVSANRMYISQKGGKWDMGINTNGWAQGDAVTPVLAEWTHLAVVFDGSDATMYINGEESFSKAYVSQTWDNNIDLCRYPTVPGTYNFDGLLDEVKVYDRALSPTELIADYNRIFSAKFVDANVIDAGASAGWDSIKVNSDVNYSFGKEICGNADSDCNADEFNNGLVGLWHLNNNANDSSGQGDNGAWGESEGYATGLWGTSAGTFDGSTDFITISDSAGLDIGTSDFSIAMWFKSGGTDSTFEVMLCKGEEADGSPCDGGSDVGYRMHMNSVLGFYIANLSGYVSVTGIKTINDTKWHHVVGVFDRDGLLSLYVDGLLDNTGDISAISGSLAGSDDLDIGRRDRSAGYSYFNGVMDEVAIWDRVLSSGEALDLYRKGVSRLDLNVYSCSDASCSESGRSSLLIEDVNNNTSYDISSLASSQYLGYDVLFRKANGLESFNAEKFWVGSFLKDVNISYST